MFKQRFCSVKVTSRREFSRCLLVRRLADKEIKNFFLNKNRSYLEVFYLPNFSGKKAPTAFNLMFFISFKFLTLF